MDRRGFLKHASLAVAGAALPVAAHPAPSPAHALARARGGRIAGIREHGVHHFAAVVNRHEERSPASGLKASP